MTHKALVKLVQRRMKERAITRVMLHEELRGRVSKQTVYNFVMHGNVIKSDTLLVVLGHLGLAVTPLRHKTK